MELFQKIEKFAVENNLIEKNDSILIALSGGADSVTLLQLLSRFRKKQKLALSAVYVNHQLRKKAGKQEELFCQHLCDAFDIELHLVSVDIKKLAEQDKTGIEETARNFRYQLFETLANECDYTKIALGHHQNDQIETILFRIFRGTGLTGLKGIPAKRDKIIRPLLGISKDEILAYTNSKNLSFCVDKSNKQSIFKRNYIRNKLIPLLKTNLNQSVEKAILNLSETISAEEEYLASIIDKKMQKLVSESIGSKIVLDKIKFTKSDLWIRRRILRNCLYKLFDTKVYPDKETIDRLDFAIMNDKKALSLPQKLEMQLSEKQVCLYPRKKIKFEQKLIISEICHLHKLNYIVSAKIKKKIPTVLKNNKNDMIARFDFTKINLPIVIRSINEGDRFNPLGMQGSKKISNYLIDKKIARYFRDEIPIVTDRNSPIWIVGHQIDERVKIDHNTTEILEIEFKRKK